MDYVAASSLIDFYNHIDVFLIIFVRILAFFIVIPIFSGQNIPTMLKIMISIAISAIVMTSGTVLTPEYDNTATGYIILILSEFINGFIIGFVVYFMFSVFYFIGQLVDYQLGYSMVSVFDPISQLQVPITGNLFYLMITALLVTGGGLDYFIQMIFESYSIIPLGHANAILNKDVVGYMITIMTKYFELGTIIALPIIGTIIIIDVALGLLVKAVPQMNVFVVGMPIKVFVGLLVLSFIMPAMYQGYLHVLDLTKTYVNDIMWGMAK